MAISVDRMGTALARRLRHERDARNWSLADLAARSGVAKTTISKIEREEASPTAVILARLAHAFGLTLARLLLRAEGEGERFVRGIDQPEWRDPETGYIRKQVFSRPDHPVETVRIEFPAGQRIVFPASTFAHLRPVIWVQVGDLVVLEGGERHQLVTGDCLALGPPSDVTLVNETTASCIYVVVSARD